VDTNQRPTVVVVGGGAAGALVCLHLIRTAQRRSTALDVVLIDPSPRPGSGTAFGTQDPGHLLNVPAAGMSALPENPGHFVAWRRRTSPGTAHPYEFVARREFARYLDDALRTAVAEVAGNGSFTHLPRTAVGVTRHGTGVRVDLGDDSAVFGDALVVATGLPGPATDWAPPALRASAFFVPDPWTPGALDAVTRDRSGPPDVLLVGTGLTAVDVAATLASDLHPARAVHAVSRSGRLPATHARTPVRPVIPEIGDWGADLDDLRTRAAGHLARVRAEDGGWRAGVDGLRFRVAALWARLSEDDRERFLREDAPAWNRLRHRMSPEAAARTASLRRTGRLTITAAEVREARPLPSGGLRVSLSDGSTRDVGRVVNCTGPRADVRQQHNPLLDDLLRERPGGALAVVATAGLGLRTRDGHLTDALGRTAAPLWTLGALRRGELWESTAVPEIRTQAVGIAEAILDAVAPAPRFPRVTRSGRNRPDRGQLVMSTNRE
jgi:uncharacterized NAD(P)/FAD-binding protein YdhS